MRPQIAKAVTALVTPEHVYDLTGA